MPRIINKMGTIWRQKLLFSVLFVFGLNQHHADCLIEFSGYTEEEIRFEMLVYQTFETMHNKCQLETNNKSSPEEWWQNKMNMHDSDSKMKDILNNLKSEISCVKSIGESNDNRLELVHFGTIWTVQFIATKYSFMFGRGHSQYKKDVSKMEMAENCKYLSAYFGAFGGDSTIRDLIHPKFFQQIDKTIDMKRYVSSGQKLMYSEFSEKLYETITSSYFSEQQETTGISVTDEHADALGILNSDFGSLLFGNERSFEITETSVTDEQLWESAGDLVSIIKSQTEITETMEDTSYFSFGFLNPFENKISDTNKPKGNGSTLIDVLRNIELQKAKPHVEKKLKKASRGTKADSNAKATSNSAHNKELEKIKPHAENKKKINNAHVDTKVSSTNDHTPKLFQSEKEEPRGQKGKRNANGGTKASPAAEPMSNHFVNKHFEEDKPRAERKTMNEFEGTETGTPDEGIAELLRSLGLEVVDPRVEKKMKNEPEGAETRPPVDNIAEILQSLIGDPRVEKGTKNASRGAAAGPTADPALKPYQIMDSKEEKPPVEKRTKNASRGAAADPTIADPMLNFFQIIEPEEDKPRMKNETESAENIAALLRHLGLQKADPRAEKRTKNEFEDAETNPTAENIAELLRGLGLDIVDPSVDKRTKNALEGAKKRLADQPKQDVQFQRTNPRMENTIKNEPKRTQRHHSEPIPSSHTESTLPSGRNARTELPPQYEEIVDPSELEKALNDMRNGFSDGSTLDLLFVPDKNGSNQLRFVKKKGGQLSLSDGTPLQLALNAMQPNGAGYGDAGYNAAPYGYGGPIKTGYGGARPSVAQHGYGGTIGGMPIEVY